MIKRRLLLKLPQSLLRDIVNYILLHIIKRFIRNVSIFKNIVGSFFTWEKERDKIFVNIISRGEDESVDRLDLK